MASVARTNADSMSQISLVKPSKAQGSNKDRPFITLELLKRLVFPVVGDPKTISLVCKQWRELQDKSYKFTLDLYKGQDILSRFIITIPKRLSSDKARIMWLYRLVMNEAAAMGLSANDFRVCGVAPLALAQVLAKSREFVANMNSKLKSDLLAPVITAEGDEEPIEGLASCSSLSEMYRVFDQEAENCDRRSAAMFGQSMLNQSRFSNLGKRKVALNGKKSLIMAAAAKAKSEVLPPSNPPKASIAQAQSCTIQ